MWTKYKLWIVWRWEIKDSVEIENQYSKGTCKLINSIISHILVPRNSKNEFGTKNFLSVKGDTLTPFFSYLSEKVILTDDIKKHDYILSSTINWF